MLVESESTRLLAEYDDLADEGADFGTLRKKLESIRSKVPPTEYESRYDAWDWAATFLD